MARADANINNSETIMQYCRMVNKPVTAKQIIDARFPGKLQPYINSTINDLVQNKKRKFAKIQLTMSVIAKLFLSLQSQSNIWQTYWKVFSFRSECEMWKFQ